MITGQTHIIEYILPAECGNASFCGICLSVCHMTILERGRKSMFFEDRPTLIRWRRVV